MTAPGDGERRWDASDLDRVDPTSTGHDVEPQVREPLGPGDAGGVSQHSPVGGIDRQVSFAHALSERFGLAGRIVVGLMLLAGVVLLVGPVVASWFG